MIVFSRLAMHLEGEHDSLGMLARRCGLRAPTPPFLLAQCPPLLFIRQSSLAQIGTFYFALCADSQMLSARQINAGVLF
jgi:hypothetical protein